MGKLMLVLLTTLLLAPAAGAEVMPDLVEGSSGIPSVEQLFDEDMETTQRLEENASITVCREEELRPSILFLTGSTEP